MNMKENIFSDGRATGTIILQKSFIREIRPQSQKTLLPGDVICNANCTCSIRRESIKKFMTYI